MTSLQISLFGSPEILLEDGYQADLRSNKAWALLAYLAVEYQQAQRRQKLVGLLWPGFTESSARANLRRALADLRQALGENQAEIPRLLITPESIQFNASSAAWVDAIQFSRLLESCSPAHPAGASPPLTGNKADEEAARLYRGPFLDGFSVPDSAAFEEWQLVTREHYHRQALQAFSHLADYYQQHGDYGRALEVSWRQLELDAWQESAHRQVMQLLALSGQRAAALAQYEACRRMLISELGVEPSPQTRQLYDLLRGEQWQSVLLEHTKLPSRAARPTGACPYRGLAAFREQDAPFFYGREQITQRLLDSIRGGATPTILLGPSGSGKSSLVFAGLIPLLRGEGRWLISAFRQGAQPFHALAVALIPWLEAELGETEQLLHAIQLADALQNQEIHLSDVIARLVDKYPPGNRFFLFIDQFEELYTLYPDPHRRGQFLTEILEIGKQETGSLQASASLLLALRADFVGQALTYRSFADRLQQGTVLLGPMSVDELHAAIEKPAEKQGATFEPGLVERILDDLGDEPGNLPLLEFALTQLWERQIDGWLTHADYEAIGQVKGALARYAEVIFNQLDPAGQAATRQVFIQLVRPGEGTQATRRTATRAEIGDQNWPLVCLLADQRLVVTGHETSSNIETVEIIHEALIQSWERLRGWVETDRAFRAWQEELRAALQRWRNSVKDEGALLRGAPLAQAESWYAKRPAEIGAAEGEFIQASQALRQRKEQERELQRQNELKAERRARRLLGGLAAVLTLAVLVALVLTTYSLRQGRQTLEAFSLSLAANAQKALEDLDSATALALALEANRIPTPPRQAQRILMDAAYAPGARWREQVGSLFPGTNDPVTALTISPDGKRALSGLEDGQIILWEIESRAEIRRLAGHQGRVNSLAFSPDGRVGLSGGDDQQAILWDLTSGEEIRRFQGHSGSVRSVAFSPDGSQVVSGGFQGENLLTPGELILWETRSAQEIRRFNGHISGIVAAAFTPSGNAIMASSGDAEIFADRLPEQVLEPGQAPFDLILWDVQTAQPLQQFRDYTDDAYSLAIAPDGKSALTGSFYNQTANLWDLETGQKLQTLEGHSEGVRAVAFSPDGRRALTASYDNSLVYWDLSNEKPLSRFKIHSNDVLSLGISPDGRFALSSGRGGDLIRWELVDAMELQRLPGHDDMVYDVALTRDGRFALSSSGSAAPSLPVLDASLRWWDASTGRQLRSAEIPVNVIFQVAISPDDRTALLATDNPAIIVWDLVSWQEIGRLEGHPAAVTALKFLPDGRRALSMGVDGRLILWDLSTHTTIRTFEAHGQGLWSLAVSPDGRTALSDSGDSSMLLWDLETGQELRSFLRPDPPPESGSSGMAFLPDGKTAISCEQDGLLIEWDVQSGSEIRRLGQHASLRTRVAITPDGSLAMTSGMDGVIKLWDLKTGELVRQSGGHGILFDLTLAPDGHSAFFGSSDRTLTQWKLSNPSLDELRAWISGNRSVRELTCAEQESFGMQTGPGCR